MVDTTELRRLHGAATQGEWFQPDGGDGDVWNGIEVGQLIPDRVIVQGPHKPSWVKTRNNDQWIDENARNLRAIVALHNAAPALLDGFDLMRDALTDIVENSADIGAVDTARAAIAALAAMMGEG